MTARRDNRAADRGQPFGLEFFDEDTGDRLYLGDPEDVDQILREFFASLVEAAMIQTDDRGEKMDAVFDEYTKIFLGERPDTHRPMPFNAPPVIGAFIRGRYGWSADEVDDRGTVRLLLEHIGVQVLQALRDHDEGKIDGEALEFRMDAALDEGLTGLMGLPVTADEDEDGDE